MYWFFYFRHGRFFLDWIFFSPSRDLSGRPILKFFPFSMLSHPYFPFVIYMHFPPSIMG